jgi:hypothetical protein
MRNQSLVYTSIMALLATVAVPKMGISRIMECTYPVDRMIVGSLNPGMSARHVIRYLREKEIRFGVYSGDFEIDISTLNEREMKRLGKIAIIVASKRKKERQSLVTEGELLTIEFNVNKRLESHTCRKYYTGP